MANQSSLHDLRRRLQVLPLLSPENRASLERRLTSPFARRAAPSPNLYTTLILKHLLPEARNVDRALVTAFCTRLGGLGISLPSKNWAPGVVVLTPDFWDVAGAELTLPLSPSPESLEGAFQFSATLSPTRWAQCDTVLYAAHFAGFWLAVAVGPNGVMIFDACGLESALPGRFRLVKQRIHDVARACAVFLPASQFQPVRNLEVIGPRHPPPRRHGATLVCAGLEFFAARALVPSSALASLSELAQLPLSEVENGQCLGEESVVEGLLARVEWLCVTGCIAGECQ